MKENIVCGPGPIEMAELLFDPSANINQRTHDFCVVAEDKSNWFERLRLIEVKRIGSFGDLLFTAESPSKKCFMKFTYNPKKGSGEITERLASLS